MNERIYYQNHAGAVAVSHYTALDGRIIIPNGRVINVQHPWVEADDDLPLSAIQEATVREFEVALEKWEAAEADTEQEQAEWEVYIMEVIQPINDRRDANRM